MNSIKEERKKVLDELLANKVLKPGQVIDYAFFQKIYEPYKFFLSEKEFAYLLEIPSYSYTSLKNNLQKSIVLNSLVEEIPIDEKLKILNTLISTNRIIPHQLIDYSYFQELYKPYSEFLSEVQFSELLELTYDNFTNIKYSNTKAKILKSKTELLKQIEQKIINNLLSSQKISPKKLITYDYFLELYEPYKKTFTDIQFANILEIHSTSFNELKNGKNKTTKILNKTQLSKEEKEQNEQIINSILLLKDIKPGILINYEFFQKLYAPYKNQFTERKFANLLEISSNSFSNIKSYPKKTASILKSHVKILSKEEKENIVKELLSNYKVTPAALISYSFFSELFEPYKEKLSEDEFAKLLEISGSNFRSFKYQGSKAKILKSYKKEISEEETEKIIDNLFSRGIVYNQQPIDYSYFLQIYKPYTKVLTENKFAELLGISYDAYSTIKRRENARAVVFDIRIKEKVDKIKYILGQESRFYSKDELYSLSEKYSIDINLILKYVFCKGCEENLDYFVDRLNIKNKLYFGQEKCSKSFAEKYSKEMINLSSKSSYILCKKYNCKSKREDFATDSLIYILNNCKDIEENCDDNEELILSILKAKIIVHIKNSCFRTLNKPHEFQTHITYTNHKGETKEFEALLEDKTENVQNIVEEKAVIKTLTEKPKDNIEAICMATLMQYIESGLTREEAIAATAKSLQIDSKTMLALLQKYLINKKKVKQTSDGDYMLW